jgi:hypothetical protein
VCKGSIVWRVTLDNASISPAPGGSTVKAIATIVLRLVLQ